jgi:acetylornithine deacetylase/succinyl-diaminopimelate desuccinylase-like protein
VNLDGILDEILVPRPNGSAGLERVAAFLVATLGHYTADVVREPFPATPYGFQLVWALLLVLSSAYGALLLRRRYRAALILAAIAPIVLVLEFELLRSPVSGLLTTWEDNVIGTFSGRPGGPTLLLCAHYDTATHFGDHLIWHRWARWLGPAAGLAITVPLLALLWPGMGARLPQATLVASALAVLVPFSAMAFFFAAGPMVRAPSPGAIDNGGSVAALLRLGESLAGRPADAPTTVKLVFFAGEEERALGSWHHAAGLRRAPGARPVAINLEGIGAGLGLTYVPEDGFAFRRYASGEALAALLQAVARDAGLPPPAPAPLPPGTLTDGRSFLAHGIPAITIRGATDEGFPRRLHSWRDSRERLSAAAIDEAVSFLDALVRHVDTHPGALAALH